MKNPEFSGEQFEEIIQLRFEVSPETQAKAARKAEQGKKTSPEPAKHLELSKAVLAVFRGRIEAVLTTTAESTGCDTTAPLAGPKTRQAVSDAKSELARASAETLAWFARACRVTDESVMMRAAEKWPIGPSEPGELADAWKTVSTMALRRGKVPQAGFWPETVSPGEPWPWLRRQVGELRIVNSSLPEALVELLRVALEGSWPGQGNPKEGQVVYAPPEREPSEGGDHGLTTEGWTPWPRFRDLGPWALGRVFEAARGPLPTYQPILTNNRFARIEKRTSLLVPHLGGPAISLAQCRELGLTPLPGFAKGLPPSENAAVPVGDVYLKKVALPARKRPLQPHQMSLALDTSTERSNALTDGAIGMVAAKLVLCALADPRVRDGQMVEAPLEDWIALMHPGKQARRRNYRALEKACLEIRHLDLVDPKDGMGEQVFSISQPTRFEPEAILRFGYNNGFLRRFSYLADRSFKGHFLVDLPGIMSFPDGREGPKMLRLYLRVAAMWGEAFNQTTGAFDAKYVRLYTRDELAAEANCLSLEAATALAEGTGQGRGKGRRTGKSTPAKTRKQIQRDRNAVVDFLERMADSKMLRIDESRGKLRILPPESYIKARLPTSARPRHN
jgi:hypothetical protein